MPEIHVDGRRCHYRLSGAGAGPRVILLHCSSSHSGQWGPLADRISDRFEVLAPDLAGYGKSDPLPRRAGPTWALDGDMIAALAGDAPVILVGHSLGGATAAFAARRLGDQCAGLAMIEPVLFGLLDEAGAGEAPEWWRASSDVAGLVANGRPDLAAERFVTFWSGKAAWTDADPRVRDYVVATIDRVPADFAGMVAGVPGQLTIADLTRLTVPTLLVHGDATRASILAIMDILAGALPNRTLVERAGMAHMAAVTDPEIMMPPIEAWLDDIRGRL